MGLTKELLDKLMDQYERGLDQLEKDPKSVTRLDAMWTGPRNRFFDIRRDDAYLNKILDDNHDQKVCPAKCRHGKCQNEIGIFSCEVDPANCQRVDGFCTVHNDCDCEIECPCYEGLSCYTFATEVFCLEKGVPGLIYENSDQQVHENDWYRTYTPRDPRDPFMLRGKVWEYQDQLHNLILSLNSIPILEKNIRRLSTELVRQESHKWSMANIRALKFMNSTWSVPDASGRLVSLDMPNEIVISIFYFASF